MSSYTTIEGRAVAEIEEKKSRFIASLAHVETEEEALAFLEEIRAANRMARHNAYAYILRQGGAGAAGRVRYSDDGEPQKTAGPPTPSRCWARSTRVRPTWCVVTCFPAACWVGHGARVRAYTQSTQAGIDAAQLVGGVALRGFAHPHSVPALRAADAPGGRPRRQGAIDRLRRCGHHKPAHARWHAAASARCADGARARSRGRGDKRPHRRRVLTCRLGCSAFSASPSSVTFSNGWRTAPFGAALTGNVIFPDP